MPSDLHLSKTVLYVNGKQVAASDFELTHRTEWTIVRGEPTVRRRRYYIAEWRSTPGGILHHVETTTPLEVREHAEGLIRYDFWSDNSDTAE